MDPYLSWQDLLDDEPNQEPTAERPAVEDVSAPVITAAGAPAEFALSPELQALIAEKERLEQQLKRMTGAAEPDPEDERLKRMFPVKTHTKETRIEEHRLKRHDEERRWREQRLLEHKRLQSQAARRREEQEAERQRKERETAQIRARWEQERHQVLLDSARRKRLEARWLMQRISLCEVQISERLSLLKRERLQPWQNRTTPTPKNEQRQWAARLEEQRQNLIAAKRQCRQEEEQRESRRQSRLQERALERQRERQAEVTRFSKSGRWRDE